MSATGCSIPNDRISVSKEEIRLRGKVTTFDTVVVDDLKLVVKGRHLRVAELREEWDQDVTEPERVIAALSRAGIRVDLFTFIQRLPHSRPRYDYFREWESVAAVPVTTYDNWLTRQIPDQTRNKLKKGAKHGVDIRRMEFGDELINGISRLYNESPIRQGTRNIHYNLPYDMVKRLNGTFLERALFYGAFHEEELVGYVKIVFTDGYARVMGILGMIRHQDKSIMNLLIAKAVEVCAERGAPYFVYGKYDYGKKVGSDTLKEFKRNNGFENMVIPRYYVPMNPYGRLALALGLQAGVKNILPRSLVQGLIRLRKMWVERQYGEGSEGVNG